MNATGRCLCGRTSFAAQDVDPHVHACHCTTCNRWNGGPGFAAGAGSVTFEGTEHIRRFDSSEWAERGFCTHCGSHLFYRLKAQDHYILCLGAFDDPTPFSLTGEIFIDEKPAAYDLAGEHQRLTGAEFLASMQSAD